MKRIGIDARLYFQTGVGVYLRNLINHLQKISPDDIEFYIYVLDSDASQITFSHPRFIKRVVSYRWHSILEQFGFVQKLYSDDLDLMHFTYFSYPIFYWKPYIATVHDLTPLLFKTGKASAKNPILYTIKHVVFTYVLSTQIHNAKHIITPTETVKNQILDRYGKQLRYKISAFYEGVDEELQNVKESKRLSTVLPDKFFLYVGNFYPHKNVKMLIQAFTKAHTERVLVLLGPNDFFSAKIQELITSLQADRKVIFIKDASREDLIYCYKNADALVHPSLSEGFGLPIIEAVYFNLPIIASDIEVFHELLGDAYDVFDPKNSNAIVDVLSNFKVQSRKKEYDLILKRFSFSHMSKQTFDLYKKYVEQ